MRLKKQEQRGKVWWIKEIANLVLNMVANSPYEEGAHAMESCKEYHGGPKPYVVPYRSFELDTE